MTQSAQTKTCGFPSLCKLNTTGFLQLYTQPHRVCVLHGLKPTVNLPTPTSILDPQEQGPGLQGQGQLQRLHLQGQSHG